MTADEHPTSDESPVDPPPADPWFDVAPTFPIYAPNVDGNTRADNDTAVDRGLFDNPFQSTDFYDPNQPDGPGAGNVGRYGGIPPRRRPVRWWAAITGVPVLLLLVTLTVTKCGATPGSGRANGPHATASTGGGATTRAATPPGQAAGGVAPSAGGAQTGGPAGTGAAGTGGAAPDGTTTTGSAGRTVVYEVTASGSGNVGGVQYTDQDGAITNRSGIPLPWKLTFVVVGRTRPLVLITQRHGGGDGGPVTCTITVDGKVLSTTTADGRYAAAECSGSG